ncbi:MAG: hypothetical protein ABI183_16935 [Polyangiaceae bacterium]
MSDLEPTAADIEAMLRVERSFEAEPGTRKALVMSRLAATATALGVAAALAPSTSWLSRLAQLARTTSRTKSAIAVGALAIGGATGGAIGHRLGEEAGRKHATSMQSVPTMVLTTLPNGPIAPTASASAANGSAPASSASTSATPQAHASTSSRGQRGDEDLAAELAFVQMARTALARGNFSDALDATDQHEKKFPHGHLAEERESLAIQALVGAGRDDEARARAARFRAKYPSSLFLPAIAAAIRTIP